MYARQFDDRVLTFRFHPDLIQRNLLLEDVETGSVWSQLGLRAVDGPLEGRELSLVPAMQTTWGDWRSRHPDTRVLAPAWGVYPSYRYVAPRGREARGLSRFALVLGVEVNGEARAYPFHELAKARGPVRDTVGGESLEIDYFPGAPAARATNLDGSPVAALTMYWGSWLDFHPETHRWHADGLTIPSPPKEGLRGNDE